MEEEDRRSLAEEPKLHQAKQEQLQFASSDIRYRNKQAQGYVVIPNGGERSTQPMGRPLHGQSRLQEARSESNAPRMPIPGLIQLPPQPERHSPRRGETHPAPYRGAPRHLEARLTDPSSSYRKPSTQRTLFDPSNPHKPIVVASREEGVNPHAQPTLLPCPEAIYQSLPADQGNVSSKPTWYDPQSER